jgi:hypothetical protein
MISPFFPPSGVIGAKRPMNFARHLPELGWMPAVVTLPATMGRDPSLERFVPQVPLWRGYRSGPIAWAEDLVGKGPATHPYKAKTAAGTEGALDRYSRYLPWVFFGARRFLRRQKCEVIYVNAGPHSGQMLGARLSESTGLPLVLDLRDPWSIEPYYREARTPEANRKVDQLEREFFQRATRIILNTESALEAYRAHYGGIIPGERFTVLRSSFEPEMYGPAPVPPGKTGLRYSLLRSSAPGQECPALPLGMPSLHRRSGSHQGGLSHDAGHSYSGRRRGNCPAGTRWVHQNEAAGAHLRGRAVLGKADLCSTSWAPGIGCSSRAFRLSRLRGRSVGDAERGNGTDPDRNAAGSGSLWTRRIATSLGRWLRRKRSGRSSGAMRSQSASSRRVRD